MKILITREMTQSLEIIDLVRSKGWEPVIVPAIEFRTVWNDDVESTLKRLSSFDWIIFTSANGVRFFIDAMIKANVDWRVVKKGKVCAIGEGTASALKRSGILPDLIPVNFIAEGIVEEFKKRAIKSKKILIPRAEKAREILPQELKRMGAKVKVLPVYRTVSPRGLKKRLLNALKEVEVVTFASSSAVKNVMRFREVREKVKKKFTAAIGPITANTLKKYGVEPSVVPEKFTFQEMLNAIEKTLLTSVQA